MNDQENTFLIKSSYTQKKQRDVISSGRSGEGVAPGIRQCSPEKHKAVSSQLNAWGRRTVLQPLPMIG